MKINFKKGFTLIELLIVIAIIGILSVVVLTSLSGSREKANRAAMIKTMKSMMPELITCADDGGYGYTAGVPTAGTTYICQNAATGNASKSTHTFLWPSVGSTGWAYGTPTGSFVGGDYQYTATKTGQTTITCSFSVGKCV